ncbi:MAG: hypothetical protein PHR78_00100 [Eubacteriales bacterium]|nr:hypothetical protein [Eubacteriales bacterium]MDD4540558.1 hypothetical protein [Eubacteriales bacterium]
MKTYRDYMDNLFVDENLHEKILQRTSQCPSRKVVKTNASRKHLSLVASAAVILIFFTVIYPLINIDKTSPKENAIISDTKGESTPFQEGEAINGDQSYIKNAPVFHTVKQLSDASDYIFRGVFSGIEKVDGATTWQLQMFRVNHLYKGLSEEKEIRMVGRTDADAHTLKTGSEYLVFATAYELPVYPWPLINPIYNQTVFEVKADGGIQLTNKVDKKMIPVVHSEDFLHNYDREITDSVVSVLHQPAYSVPTSYSDAAEMLANSDLAARVTFSEIEYINEYVSIGKVERIQAEYKSDPQVALPVTIAINEELKTGQEYLVFLRYDSERDGLVLAARTGAIVSPTHSEKWDEVFALFH